MTKVSFEHYGSMPIAETSKSITESSLNLLEFMQQNDPFLKQMQTQNKVSISDINIREEALHPTIHEELSVAEAFSKSTNSKEDKYSSVSNLGSLWEFMQQNDPFLIEKNSAEKIEVSSKTDDQETIGRHSRGKSPEKVNSAEKHLSLEAISKTVSKIKPTLPTKEHINSKVEEFKLISKKLGQKALVATVLAGTAGAGFFAVTAVSAESNKHEEITTEYIKPDIQNIKAADKPTKTKVQSTTSVQPVETTTVRPEKPFEILPKPQFLTPEGALIDPDYILDIPTIGSHILGYERPIEESENVEGPINSTVINTLTAPQTPQVITPQVAEYAALNPGFKPTLQRTGKAYWQGKSAGEFQKTAMHEHGYSVYPGEVGNAMLMAHGSTRNAGGGDLPALKIGDTLTLTRPQDGKVITYKFVEREVIPVDKNGYLTQAAKDNYIKNGYGEDVNYGKVAYNYRGHENQTTLTIQICSDLNAIPGGNNGRGAADARVLYRFIAE